jgi:SAM-dependent methyltransferase
MSSGHDQGPSHDHGNLQSRRRDRLLGKIPFGTCLGLEIGALHAPTVRRSEGRIFYVDYADAAVLRETTKRNDVDPADIVDVDIVWGQGTSLAEAIGEKADYAVASHVIEHVPDLVGWLLEIRDTLKDGAVFGLAVPDRRVTFDSYRNDSVIAEVLEAYIQARRRPSARQIIESGAFSRDDMTWPDWRPNEHHSLPPSALTRLPGVFEWVRQSVVPSSSYIDAHCWVFTPESFLALAEALFTIGRFPFVIEAFFPTQPGEIEFIVRLRAAARPDDPAIQQSIADARAALNQPERAAPDRLADCERQLAALHASNSWRITAPLRRITSHLRRHP